MKHTKNQLLDELWGASVIREKAVNDKNDAKIISCNAYISNVLKSLTNLSK